MTRLRIKLCGVRRARDAELCAQAGADEIGVVFAPHSRRCVTVAGAREIRAALPDDVRLVGVFQDAALSEALRVAEEVGLCAVQLHGVLPEPSGALPLYAALQVDGEAALARVAALRGFRRLLLDGPAGGGGGVAFGWTLAQKARSLTAAGSTEEIRRLATPATEVIDARGTTVFPGFIDAHCHPDGVDVASGIEGPDGFKDPARVRDFVAASRAAARELA